MESTRTTVQDGDSKNGPTLPRIRLGTNNLPDDVDLPTPRSGDLLLPQRTPSPPSSSSNLIFPPAAPPSARERLCRSWVFVLTFLCYTAYHASRKPLSVVKNVLHRNCTDVLLVWNRTKATDNGSVVFGPLHDCSWAPFDNEDYGLLLGSLDYAFLFSYSAGLFLSGHIGERLNIKYYLGIGMLLCALSTCGLGLAYFCDIHSMTYFIAFQIVGGLFQSTGWPSVVSIMGNWFGKKRRGFIMGVWNAHTSIGNILGSVMAALFVSDSMGVLGPAWGWSFILPGAFIGMIGVVVLFTLVVRPEDIGFAPPIHHINETNDEEKQKKSGEEQKNSKQDGDESSDSGRSSTDSSSDLDTRDTFYLADDEEKNALDGVKDSHKHSDAPEVTYSKENGEPEAIGFWRAIKIPGVVQFSTCLFFAKLVSYTFLFWLPNYIKYSTSLTSSASALLSTAFDVGGILGGVVAGAAADLTSNNEVTCITMLLCATPTLVLYQYLGQGIGLVENVLILAVCGLFINGPYALITTAVSADLGTHESLSGNTKALATVSAIIDGAGSVGAAIGPLLTGVLTSAFSWHTVFYMLIGSSVAAVLPLVLILVRRRCAKGRATHCATGRATGCATGCATGSATGRATGCATGCATGRATGCVTSCATHCATGQSTKG